MVRECAHEECATLTMGRYCLEHELLMAAQPVALTVDAVTSSAPLVSPVVGLPPKQPVSA